jgi:hypothetical protein
MSSSSQTGGGKTVPKSTKTQPNLGIQGQPQRAAAKPNIDALLGMFGNLDINKAKPQIGRRTQSAPSRFQPRRIATGKIAKVQSFTVQAPARKTTIISKSTIDGILARFNRQGEIQRKDLETMRNYIEQMIKRIQLKDAYLEFIEKAFLYVQTGTDKKHEADALESLIAGLEGFGFGKSATAASQRGGASPLMQKLKDYKYRKNSAGLNQEKVKIQKDRNLLQEKLEDASIMYIPMRDELISRGLLQAGDELASYVPPTVGTRMEMEGGKRRRRRTTSATKRP